MGLSGTGKLSLKERSQYKSGILWALGPQMSSAWVPGPPLVLTFRHKKEFKMPQNNLLWTYSDWAGNISCGSHTRRHKSMGFPWPKVMPLAAGEKKCFQNKLKKKFTCRISSWANMVGLCRGCFHSADSKVLSLPKLQPESGD